MPLELTSPAQTTPVLAAPFLDPGAGRVSLELPAGLRLAEIVEAAVPGRLVDTRFLRVALVTDDGMNIIEPVFWHVLRPRPGVRVVIRVLPGKSGFRSILLAVVSIAAVSLGGFLGGLLVPASGLTQTLVSTALGAGLSVVGSLLVGALLPIETPDVGEGARDVYQISGWRNQARPGEPVPLPLGRMRYAPPFAARSYSEIINDSQYVRALFCAGYGPIQISDIRIGQTPIDEFRDLEIEVREGRPDDEPITLYDEQVIEDVANVTLVRPYPEDGLGNLLRNLPAISTPRIWRTADDTARVNVILTFPRGLIRQTSDGLRNANVSVAIRLRPEGTTEWVNEVVLNVDERRREQFWRQYSYILPSRGRWEVELERLTPTERSDDYSDEVSLAAVQSIRPERPIAIDTPLALIAVRVRATNQLNGALDDLNAILHRYGPVPGPDGAWGDDLTQNPASAAILSLTGPSNAFPVLPAQIDWDGFREWYEFCDLKGLRHNAVRDQSAPLREMLAAIGSSGRAAIRHDGIRWGVVIDRPTDLVVDHVSPRNASGFLWRHPYFDPPDGFRVPFLDETRDFQPAERIVPWPGFVGVPEVTETVELPGKTDPHEIWVEARRKMFELIYRSESFSAVQDGAARIATRGDQVMANVDVLDVLQVSAVVRDVQGDVVVLDEAVHMEEGLAYALRFKVASGDQADLFPSVVRRVVAEPGTTYGVRLERGGSLDVPTVGWVVHFGPVSRESTALKLRGLEAGENLSVTLDMVPAAPEIDLLTDAEVPPAWTGRVGQPVSSSDRQPAVPRIVSVASSMDLFFHPNPRIVRPPVNIGIRVDVAPGAGSTVPVASYVIEHRAVGQTVFSAEEFQAAEASVTIDNEPQYGTAEFRVYALSITRVPSPPTPLLTFEYGSDVITPDVIPPSNIMVQGFLGHVVVTVVTTSDEATSALRLYRVPEGEVLDQAVHAIGRQQAVAPSSTFTIMDGDATRRSLVTDGSFGDASAWSAGPGWSVAGGTASHSPGTPADLRQDIPLIAGRRYRISFDLRGRIGGTVGINLTGDTTVSGGPFSENGQVALALVAPANADGLTFAADATFDGSIDDVVVFEETPASVPAGTWEYYVEPLSENGIVGPAAGPFKLTLI